MQVKKLKQYGQYMGTKYLFKIKVFIIYNNMMKYHFKNYMLSQMQPHNHSQISQIRFHS